MSRFSHGRFLPLLAVIVSILCSGCAYSYVADDGSRRLIGLVDMRIQPEADPTYAGSVVDIRSVGLSMHQNEQGTNLSAGYSREITAVIRNHALVKGNPLQVGESANVENHKNGGSGQ